MVRREEQRWRNRALLLLDTRRMSHYGTGMTSSFEFAVSAAASVGVHVAREGLDGELITDTGSLDCGGAFEDVLLDTLAVIRPSNNRDLSRGLAAVRSGDGGLIVAVTGSLSVEEAGQLAACRRDQCQGIALLLAATTWTEHGGSGQPGPGHGPAGNGSRVPAAGTEPRPVTNPVAHEETAGAAAVLGAAGWRVVSIDASTPLALAWQRLPRFGEQSMAGLSGLGADPSLRTV
jgi:hypothetical protein